ncbi:MAG: SMC-Scp complex subunit ScpB [Vicinamibacterales bacterium]
MADANDRAPEVDEAVNGEQADLTEHGETASTQAEAATANAAETNDAPTDTAEAGPSADASDSAESDHDVADAAPADTEDVAVVHAAADAESSSDAGEATAPAVETEANGSDEGEPDASVASLSDDEPAPIEDADADVSGESADSAASDGADAEALDDSAAADAERTGGDLADGESSGSSDAASVQEDGVDGVDSDEDFKRPAAEVKAIVEALIFASPDPLTPKSLLKLLDSEPKEDVLAALEELKVDYERQSGLQLVEVAGGFQIVTRPDLHEWVRRLFHERSTQKLSVQALESLAVIAYRQPITAIEITEIRGVNTSGVLNTLLERHLVKIVGRKQVVGRPFMYATTKEFLIRFGLKDLSDLPKVEDMAESLGIESRLLVEQTPPEEQLPLSEPDGEDLPFDASASESTIDDAAGEPVDDSPAPSDDESEPEAN